MPRELCPTTGKRVLRSGGDQAICCGDEPLFTFNATVTWWPSMSCVIDTPSCNCGISKFDCGGTGVARNNVEMRNAFFQRIYTMPVGVFYGAPDAARRLWVQSLEPMPLLTAECYRLSPATPCESPQRHQYFVDDCPALNGPQTEQLSWEDTGVFSHGPQEQYGTLIFEQRRNNQDPPTSVGQAVTALSTSTSIPFCTVDYSWSAVSFFASGRASINCRDLFAMAAFEDRVITRGGGQDDNFRWNAATQRWQIARREQAQYAGCSCENGPADGNNACDNGDDEANSCYTLTDVHADACNFNLGF